MRNATSVGTQTSKIPIQVALLFIFYFVVRLMVCFPDFVLIKRATSENLTSTSLIMLFSRCVEHDYIVDNASGTTNYL